MRYRVARPRWGLIMAALLLSFSAFPASAEDMPKLSSSLAKNLWRQCHMYFEVGKDAQAERACTEMQAWARANNEAQIEREMADMLAQLTAREQPVAPAQAPRQPRASEIRADDPACGFGSAAEIPDHHMVKIVTGAPEGFHDCSSDADCVVVKGYCGAQRAVSTSAQACFETAVRKFHAMTPCDAVDQMDVSVRCHDNTCMIQY